MIFFVTSSSLALYGRPSIIFFAVASPIPFTLSTSTADAVLISIGSFFVSPASWRMRSSRSSRACPSSLAQGGRHVDEPRREQHRYQNRDQSCHGPPLCSTSSPH